MRATTMTRSTIAALLLALALTACLPAPIHLAKPVPAAGQP